MICAKCGEEMRLTEKDTSSGRDIREYKCDKCGYGDWEVRGLALWQILHDDREEFEAAKAAREAADAEAQAEYPEHEEKAASSRWGRFLAWLGGSRKKG